MLLIDVIVHFFYRSIWVCLADGHWMGHSLSRDVMQ